MKKIAELLASIKAQVEELEELLTEKPRRGRKPKYTDDELRSAVVGKSTAEIAKTLGVCSVTAWEYRKKFDPAPIEIFTKEKEFLDYIKNNKHQSFGEVVSGSGISHCTVRKYLKKHNITLSDGRSTCRERHQLELPLADPTPAQPLPLRIVDMFVDTEEYVTYADIANATGASTDAVRQALDQLRNKLNVNIRFDNKQRGFLLHS